MSIFKLQKIQFKTEVFKKYFLSRGRRHVVTSDGRYYRKSIEIIDTYKSIDTFDTRKKYR
jgi:hypothetical protein